MTQHRLKPQTQMAIASAFSLAVGLAELGGFAGGTSVKCLIIHRATSVGLHYMSVAAAACAALILGGD